jgi:hypothetical protein
MLRNPSEVRHGQVLVLLALDHSSSGSGNSNAGGNSSAGGGEEYANGK